MLEKQTQVFTSILPATLTGDDVSLGRFAKADWLPDSDSISVPLPLKSKEHVYSFCSQKATDYTSLVLSKVINTIEEVAFKVY